MKLSANQTKECLLQTLAGFLQEGLAPINLIVEDKFHRATPGGTGGVKTIGNYASVIFLYYFVAQVIETLGLLYFELCSLIFSLVDLLL
jgi:hypothetical protein